MMRAISVYLSLCLLALCLTFPGRALADEECFAYQENFAAAQEHPNVQGTRELDKEELERVVAFTGADAQVPFTISTGYLALMLDNSVRFIFGPDGKVCKMMTIPAHKVPALVEVVVGRPA